MINDSTHEDNGVSKQNSPKLTSAGHLLRLVTKDDAIVLPQLARHLKVPAGRLRACRDGQAALEPEVQLMLAALVLELSPEHSQHARRLYAQAQSALRVREGAVESHAVYVGRRWR
jgi:hypothetical protein